MKVRVECQPTWQRKIEARMHAFLRDVCSLYDSDDPCSFRYAWSRNGIGTLKFRARVSRSDYRDYLADSGHIRLSSFRGKVNVEFVCYAHTGKGFKRFSRKYALHPNHRSLLRGSPHARQKKL